MSKHGTHYYILFDVTAAHVVPCGIPKKRPSTSSIVQFILFFWSFEISRNILINQKILSVKIHIYSKQFFLFEPYLDLFQSLYDFFTDIRNYSIFFWLSLPSHSGSLKRIDYPKQLPGPPSFL